tara:strand:+ start:1281 stop:2015 length:735 start_codon:yes stop_codon:yes gene_type:complete
MALDLEKMKQRQASLQGRGGNGNDFWKPEEGEQVIRIVPMEDGDPFKDYWFHYGVGEARGFLCPKRNFGDECPVCSFASQLWNSHTNGDADAGEEAKKLFAKQRFFSPVIIREQHDTPKVWGYSKTVYEQLLNLVFDPDYGDITDVMEGNDIRLIYSKPAGRRFPMTEIRVRPHKTALFDDKDQIKAAIDNIPDFGALFERKSSAEVQETLDQFLIVDNPANSAADSNSGDSSIESSFNELLNA